MIFDKFGEMILQDGGDIRMGFPPLTPKQRIIDRIAQQYMFEGETDGRRNVQPIDNVGFFKQRERREQIVFVDLDASDRRS